MPNCNHCKIINHKPCELLCCCNEVNLDCPVQPHDPCNPCGCNEVNLDCPVQPHDPCNPCGLHARARNPCDPCNKPCNKPCINGALPLLTKCGLIRKKQKQNNIVRINSCNCNLKRYNKKYSFNDQLLILKSHALKRNDCCRC